MNKNYLDHRFDAAAVAICLRFSGVSILALAGPPRLPPSLPLVSAAMSLPSSSRSSTCPVAISTISFPSWIGSRGRLRRRVAMGVIWHAERGSETRRREASRPLQFKLTHYPTASFLGNFLTSIHGNHDSYTISSPQMQGIKLLSPNYLILLTNPT
jgi:hypothetical protein